MRPFLTPSRAAIGLYCGLASALGACKPTTLRCVVECVRPPSSALDGHGRTISHLRVGALLPESKEDPSGGFYVYLLFLDRKSKRTHAYRRSAAEAVMNMFSGTVDHRTTESSKNPAVFYVPMSTLAGTRQALVESNPEVFLQNYDYELAEELLQPIVAETHSPFVFRVALVGSARPLRPGEPLDLDHIYCASLERPPAQIPGRIQEFLDALTDPSERISETQSNAWKCVEDARPEETSSS